MIVKRTGKTVLGADLTVNEKKALKIEVQKMMDEYCKGNSKELIAMILWELHEQFGFGPKRLRRFYDNFDRNIDALGDRYEMETDEDKIWLTTQKLKEYGIDVDEWANENRVKETRNAIRSNKKD